MAYKPKHVVEYVLLRGLIAVTNLLPLPLAYVLIWPLALLMRFLFAGKLREARRRMRLVLGPDVPERQLRRWAWISWRNLFFTVVENTRAHKLTPEQIRRWIDIGDIQRCIDHQKEKGGFVLAVCHMGNWDLAGFAVRKLGLPIFVLFRGQSNPLTTRYMTDLRDRVGVGWVDRHGRALGSIIKRIRGGEVFTILPDIRSKQKESAIPIPFLGGTAHLYGGMALFAKHTNTPIYTVLVSREGWTRHRWQVGEPILPDPALDKESDILRMTTETMARFDRAIRAHPEQYFWYNKRWVLDPHT